MAVVFRTHAVPPANTEVVVHMGAGVVENAVGAALRNHDDYRTPNRTGAFCLSVFCATGGVSVSDIIGALPHSQYGIAGYGDIGKRWEVWPTTIPGALGSRRIEEVHFDVVLPVPSPGKPIGEITEGEHHELQVGLDAAVRPLLALFVPRQHK